MNNEISRKLYVRLDGMESLRDEMRVRIHLGRMDARQIWGRVEKRLERLATHVVHGGDFAANQLLRSLDTIRLSLNNLRRRLVEKRHQFEAKVRWSPLCSARRWASL